jgi:hypothetical protein
MRRILFIAFFGLLAMGKTAIAQEYQVPQNYTLKDKGDYAKYEQDVINTVDWLQQTSWDDQPDRRKEANAFLIAWITGSPNVSISVGTPLVKLTKKNPELMITFMGAYTKYCLQHKDAQNVNAANVAGLKALIAKYQMEKNHKHEGAVEDLIKIDANGKLEEWAATDYLKS